MSSVPEDLYLDILLKLPAQSLLTSKCVCKTWLKLISDDSFVHSHLDLHKNVDPSLIINPYPYNQIKKGIYSISCQSLISSSSTEDLYENSVELDYPFKSLQHVGLVGSCNGLVCLYLEGSTWDNSFFCLWNPATGEYKKARKLPVDMIHKCGFGYDCKNDDYMLVSYGSSSMAVYTLRSNSWKFIQTKPYRLLSEVFVNGTLHWLAERLNPENSKVIITWDSSNEGFEELQLPEEPKAKNHVFRNLAVLEGCLTVFVEVRGVQWEVWVMQNYGVGDSWTKCHVIPRERVMKESSLAMKESSIRLKWIFKDGEILLDMPHGNDIVLYNMVHAIPRVRDVCQIEKYVESLVSLNSGT